MRSFILSTCLVILFTGYSAWAQQASFTAPDTVCVNEAITLTNTSTGGSSFYWNFCAGNLYQPPTAVNFGNINGAFQTPVFLEMAQEGGNYYAFVTNNAESLVRLSFGNSLLNTPTAENLGNFGGQIPRQTEGLRIVQDANGWHVLIVGGGNATVPSIAIVDFGASLSNTPTCTNWGNIGNLAYPIDLFTFQEGGIWYGFTINADNNTLTRFNFGTSFATPPSGVNMGNLGNLDYPTGMFLINVSGNWFMFVTNGEGQTITRLDFGNSMLNTPTAVNLGNPGGILNHPRDIYVFNDCGGVFALVANGDGDDLVRLDFDGGVITGNITASSYGNIGSFRYPHSLSAVFRVQDDLYTFVANAFNNSLTRVKFSACTNSSVPSSTLVVPPSFTYSQPGTYTVNMIMDEGLPTQQSTCRNIVVMPPPTVDLGTDQITSCNSTPVTLNAGTGNTHYLWSDNSTANTLLVRSGGTYSVVVSNGGACTASDQVEVMMSPAIDATIDVTNIDCANPVGAITVTPSGGLTPFTYRLNNTDMGTGNSYTNLAAGTYNIEITDAIGCAITRSVDVTVAPNASFSITATPVAPTCNGLTDGAINITVNSGQPPFEFALDDQPYQRATSFDNLGVGNYKVYGRAGACLDSAIVAIIAPPVIDLSVTPTDETCSREDGALEINGSGGTLPYTYELNGVPINTPDIENIVAGDYNIKIIDANGCEATADVTLNNLDIAPVTITNSDTTISIGDKVELHAVNAVDYSWTPVTGVSCADCATTTVQPLQTTTYIVITPSGRNCAVSDSVTIYVDTRHSLFIPTAFTPNKDGVNDVFRVKAKAVAVFNMMIYNRWGEVIFRSGDVSKGWDGTYMEQLQPGGAYVYMIEYAFYDDVGKIYRQQGTVTLVR
ncbi:gliding motility-associated C-terminal domain-containing protein [Chitinophaga sp. YR627]|uniref:T9SS type B sorting domain-containing protein n=1 Tax=Chitinophaga sp. YR627 TaxID=1881041 RepID=UPI0008EC9270|nr:gliding motility-associated C-terminal domain-containing protein [Chitinophaga sp. YR627]SFM77002.1 gliding motility-associated C-terminal domain-containing protein [Chitinophaga sp. YR627]